jgi:hypothetical protein
MCYTPAVWQEPRAAQCIREEMEWLAAPRGQQGVCRETRWPGVHAAMYKAGLSAV